MSTNGIDGLAGLNLQDLIGKYTPEDRPIEVILPEGEVLQFRPLRSHGDLKNLLDRATEFARNLRDPVHPASRRFTDVMPETAEDMILAYMIAELSMEPKFDQRTAMQLMRAPWLVRHIRDTMDLANKSMLALALAAAVEEAKKNSSETPLNESESPSHETSTESTPTI